MGNPRSASEGAEEQQPQSLKEDAFHSGAGAGQGKDAAGDQAEGVASRTTREWLAVCERLDIPAGPVNTLEQLFEDPHLRAVGFFQTVENADNVGAALLSSPGVRFNGALPKLRPASRLGQDTRQVLREAGLSEDEIAALHREFWPHR